MIAYSHYDRQQSTLTYAQARQKTIPGSSVCLDQYPTLASRPAPGAVSTARLRKRARYETLSESEIEALGLKLVLPVHEIAEARRMCQVHHPDRGGDPEVFQHWKEKLDRLRRRVRR